MAAALSLGAGSAAGTLEPLAKLAEDKLLDQVTFEKTCLKTHAQ